MISTLVIILSTILQASVLVWAYYVIQFNSYLRVFTCKLNIPEANYKVSIIKGKKQQQNT
jgi:hypothetical protein